MGLAAGIENLVGRTVEAMGFRLVRVRLRTAPRRTLEVMAERADGAPVGIEDCALVSRAVGVALDAEDAVAGAYDLEVGSPGIDRPLVRPEDFERFAGFEARVTVEPPRHGRRRFRGRVAGVAEGLVRLDPEDGAAVELPFGDIVEAQLVLTDELIGATKAGRAGAAAQEAE